MSAAETLAPFLLTTLLYWGYYIPATQPGVLACILKILPTISLAWIVWKLPQPRTAYQEGIFKGLAASVAGDGFLVWPSMFVPGMLGFAAAHIHYIRSLLWRSPSPPSLFSSSLKLGIPLFGFLFTFYWFILRPTLPTIDLQIGVPVYCILLTITVWRSGVEGDWMMFLGSILFMFSDATIAVNMFYQEVPASQVIIMSTYQLGQMLIALSAILEDKLKIQ